MFVGDDVDVNEQVGCFLCLTRAVADDWTEFRAARDVK